MHVCAHIPGCLLVCQSLFICECVHACIVCIYQGGWGVVTESMVQIKKGQCAKGVMTRKREPRGSQGNLLLPGPCKRARGALSHLVLCLSTCTLFAQATVIILMISWLARSPHRRAVSTDLTSPSRCHSFIQLEVCRGNATKRTQPRSRETIRADPGSTQSQPGWRLRHAWRSLKRWIPGDVLQPNFYTLNQSGESQWELCWMGLSR